MRNDIVDSAFSVEAIKVNILDQKIYLKRNTMATGQLRSMFNDFQYTAFLSRTLSAVATAPFKRVKLLQQLHPELKNSSVVGTMKEVTSKQGFRFLWRGFAIDFILRQLIAVPVRKIVLPLNWLYTFVKRPNNRVAWLAWVFGAAAVGSASLLITYPINYISTRIALDFPDIPQVDIISRIQQKIQDDGFLSLYNGIGLTFCEIFVYRGFYFGIYDLLKLIYLPKTYPTAFIFGWTVTLSAVFLSYPLDTVRHYQIYRSISTINAVRELWLDGGISRFFRGAVANLLRSIVGLAVSELLSYLFKQLQSSTTISVKRK